MKRFFAWMMVLMFFLLPFAVPVRAADFAGTVDAESAILMEIRTGRVLYEKNADKPLPPASVTKIMTDLLVAEAIDAGTIALTDTVTASTHASKMGGSQIYLKEGEQMSVDDLLKSVVVASANDAAVALAEYVAGSEEAFVAKMNERAAELGMEHTHFENTNGLDDTTTAHLTTARDIALMSCELLKHEWIQNYTKIWMDTVRDGAFGLTNTNRLIRFYKGATGLKTGSTSKAKFCISASAERDGLGLVAVIMASPTRDVRNAAAASLLDYGFANFSYWHKESEPIGDVPVTGGTARTVSAVSADFSMVTDKGADKKATAEIILPETLAAPVEKGAKIGEIVYRIGETELGRADVVAGETVEKIGFFTLLPRMFFRMIGAKAR
ncbi:MAG: D-alanyl-D-alanine carboxypeptidase [Ruminococcus sp.]|nr:D-alanyl-D-alanine carboxypeptidase [Candidatus Apopatosoma intestinale]